MKKFIKFIWALFKVALFTVGALTILGIVAVIMIVLATPDRPRIEDKSVLVFDLTTSITDRPVDDGAAAFARIFGQEQEGVQLRAAIMALQEAATDKRISGLYLRGNLQSADYSSGYAALKELRGAIQDFEKSGKPVIAYIQDADNRDLYILSAADQIMMNPLGILGFRGLASQGIFFKGAEDKYGIDVTPTRHGKYKSAIEPLTRQDFSPENREQISALLNVIWGDLLNTVAGARKINPEELQALVDEKGMIDAPTAKSKGLVTDLAYEGQVLDKLRMLTGKKTTDKYFPQIMLNDYAHEAAHNVQKRHYDKDKIAVVYAEGEIIDGDRAQDGQVAGGKLGRTIRELRMRKDIKGLVLRVNSPGGSGQASEVILDELRRFNADRPVIVSMGTVAASGGYYISMASRRILAEPTTITGSIGVFGLGMNVQKLANDHGITFDTVKTAKLADLGTISRPMTPEEQTVMQNVVDTFYMGFVERVAAGRKMTTNQVDEIGQGRVWSGQDALKIGLVDEMGGLEKAISIAAQQAGVPASYSIVEYPEKKPFVEQLGEALSGKEQPLVKQDLGSRVLSEMKTELRWFSSLNDPAGIYARLPYNLELN